MDRPRNVLGERQTKTEKRKHSKVKAERQGNRSTRRDKEGGRQRGSEMER